MNKQFNQSVVCGFALAAALLGPAAFAADSGSADSLSARLDYLQTAGAKHVAIDTGYYVQTNTSVDLDMQLTSLVNNEMQRIFGLYPNSGVGMTMLLYDYPTDNWSKHEYRVRMGPYDKSANENTKVAADLLRHTHTLDVCNAAYYLDGVAKYSNETYKPRSDTPQSSMSLRFFLPNTTSPDLDSMRPHMRLFGSKFYEWENGEKVLKRDWVPWRAEDGRLGVYDLVTKSFKPQDAEVLTWRLAFSLDGATLRVHEGTLAAEHLTTNYMRQCEQEIAAVEKVTFGELKAGAVTAYVLPLTIAQGAFSLQDGAAKAVTVDGALKLTGGTTLKIDVVGSACDSITATSVSFEDATAENPVMFDVTAAKGADWSSEKTVLATGVPGKDGIVDFIRVVQNGPEPLLAKIENGALVMLVDPNWVDDRAPALLDYLQTAGAKKVSIDTGYYVQPTTCVDLDMQLTSLVNGEMQRIFGLYADTGNGMTMLIYDYPMVSNWSGHQYRVRMGPYDKSQNDGSGEMLADLLRHTHTLDACNAEYYRDGVKQFSNETYKPRPDTPQSRLPLRFFLPHNSNASYDNMFPHMRLFGSKFYEWENGVKVLKRDWVPWRTEDGQLGVYDLVTKSFKPQDKEVLTWRLAYSLDGATLRLHEGSLAEEHFSTNYMKQYTREFEAVRKVTSGELKAGAITTYALPLTIAQGAFSLQDDAAKAVTVDGVLRLMGGTTLKIDVLASGGDTISATSVSFEDATAENPITIDVKAAGASWADEPVVLASGVPGEDGIVDFIRVTQDGSERLLAKIKGGALVLMADPDWNDDLAVRLDYLQTAGERHVAIDTGYYVQTNTCVDLDFQLTALKTAKMQRLFGLYPDMGNGMTMLLYDYPMDEKDDHQYRVRMGPYDLSANTGTSVRSDLERHVHTIDAYNAEYCFDGVGKVSLPSCRPLPDTPQSRLPFRFFLPSGNAYSYDNMYPSMRLFGSKFYEWENGVKVLKRDWVPWRTGTGRIGVYDLVTKSFKPQDAEVLTWRLAFTLDESTLRVHEGALAPEHLTTSYMRQCEQQGIAAVEKVSPGELKAGAVTAYATPLTVKEGVFSVQDGAAKAITVAGALTLKGGTALKIDVVGADCDSIAATSVSFEGATTENPITIDVTAKDADWSEDKVLLASGVPGADGDVDFIRVTQDGPAPLSAKIRSGALVLCADLNFVATAEWKGRDGDALDEPSNWVCRNVRGEVMQGKCPTASTTVVLPDGCTFNCPAGTPFAAYALSLPATIGADCDWTGITAPFTGRLDLNGRKLSVSQLTGDAEITDSNAPGYQLLESISSTGTQYIDTGVKAQCGLKFDFDLMNLDSGDNKAVMGYKNDSQFSNMFLPLHYAGGWGYGYGNGYWPKKNEARNVRQEVHTELLSGSQKIVVNGVETKSSSVGPKGWDANLYLFAINNWNEGVDFAMKLRLYSCRISDAVGNPVREFVPVKRIADNVVGLMDMVEYRRSGTISFYANRGLGAFTAGTATNVLGVAGGSSGELRVVVAGGKAVENATVKLSGALRLVKEGMGEFIASKKGQTYTGGTVVSAGSAKATVTISDATPWGLLDSSVITVGKDATFDVNGLYDYGHYRFALAGGTLANNGTDLTKSVENGAWGCGDVTLLADSSYDVARTLRHGKNGVAYALDMGGNALSVSVASGKEFSVGGACDWRNGTVKVSGQGKFAIDYNKSYSPAAHDFSTVDFDLGVSLRLDNTILVRDLTMRYAGSAAGAGTGLIKVLGTYLPVTDYVYNIEMQDGSTIDLSSRTEAFRVVAKPLTFADDATIFIDLGARKAKSEKILDWTDEKPSNFGSLTFRLAPGQAGSILKRDDGLYLLRGMKIVVQ